MNRKNIPYFLLFLLFIGNSMGCSEKQKETSQRQLFDLNWKYSYGNYTSAFAVDFNDKNWQDIDLPHIWSDSTKQGNNLSTCVDSMDSGTLWYRKHFEIPENWQKKTILVDFEGIGKDSEIFINGIAITDTFKEKNAVQACLTPYLNHTTGRNLIAVRFNNCQKQLVSADSKAGIYKNVWLIVKDAPQ